LIQIQNRFGFFGGVGAVLTLGAGVA